ncbi:chromosomal replication initiator protein DnaA [Taibaiella sp. KBW10]|uniref:chromosomal replication initiator protein DnaA n=1 Tax=Taibaiella sp. KBW10 TaxID=2153357 RepID=UPI000F5ADE55|nr:chromosomal replication initiator protein DnaA [Taibaiella sp. KBW10]RQO32332.1 chromosomal replication initiator protein DnaA [Taibaiella sp. KBW10]
MNQTQPTIPQEHLDPATAWERCMLIIEDNVNRRAYQTWFLPIRAVDLSNNILTIQVPSQFFYEWLEEHYVELLAKTIKRVLGRAGQLAYRIQMENNSQKQPATMQLPASSHAKPSKENNFIDMPLMVEDPSKIKNPFAIPGMKRMQIDAQLNANLTFDNFIEGECNILCRNSGLRVAQKPGETSFNPLMIFGGTGCGKTHLMQAIGNDVRKMHPNKTVLYVSAEKFINQYIEHSKNREVGDFINFYQLIDVLLLDDIHIFTNAPKAQDALFAIFNHLHQNGKQIVLTSDTAPKDLDGMQERLLSRFRWGLTAEMLQPDFETRKSILEVIMRNEGTEISEEVAQYIAFNIQNNIRDLRGAVISILAQSTLLKKDIDLELAKRVVKNLIKTPEKEICIGDIQKMVCSYFKIDYDKLQSKTRTGDVVNARQIAMYLAKKFTKCSLKTIGDHFGKRDHTTVIHSVQKVEDFLKTDEKYRESFLEIQHKVQLAAM